MPSSDTSSSTNVSGEQRIVVRQAPPPMPGTPGAPFFDGRDITEFLERFEDMCSEYYIDKESQVVRLPKYCETSIGRYVRTMQAYQSKDWEELKAALAKDYRHTDSLRQLYTRQCLEALKKERRTPD